MQINSQSGSKLLRLPLRWKVAIGKKWMRFGIWLGGLGASIAEQGNRMTGRGE